MTELEVIEHARRTIRNRRIWALVVPQNVGYRVLHNARGNRNLWYRGGSLKLSAAVDVAKEIIGGKLDD